MIRIQNLTLRFGERALFDKISFTITEGEKLAVTGRNGSGKSTLIKVLSGVIPPDEGFIEKPKKLTVGYLRQELPEDEGRSVKDEVLSSMKEIESLKTSLQECEDLLHKPDLDHDEMIRAVEEMSELQHRLEYLNADKLEGEIEKILTGLGFKPSDLVRQTREFSGGWRMRVELAKLLLAKPDLMLLDEPNNHLDILSIQWLEKYLIAYEGSVLLISHDLMFVNNIAKRIIEVDRGRIYDFVGTYSDFINYKKERREVELNEYKSQQKLIQHKEQLIDKFRAKANKASFAKSLQSELARMDVMDEPDDEQGSIRLRFQPSHPGGRIVVEAHHLSKSYGALEVLKDLDFMLERGQKLSFIGQNGQGKSTMVKLLSKAIDPTHGHLKYGHEIKIGYFAQEHGEILNPDLTIMETIEYAALPQIRPMIRKILGGLGFSGEDVDKRIKVLSGGEKSRVRLAVLLVQEHNFLILDEPTHHLDIPSKESLKEAIKQYKGTVVIVSHDREFLRDLAERTCFFSNQTIRFFEGDIDYFLEKIEATDLENTFSKQQMISTQDQLVSQKSNPQNLEEKKKMLKRIQILEKDIESGEKKKKDFELKMADPEFYQSRDSQKILSEYQKIKSEIDLKTVEWERLIEQSE